MTSTDDLSPLAALRGECLHLAVRMLAYSDAERIDPHDAIRLAEEYVVWILEAGNREPAESRSGGHPLGTVPSGVTASSNSRSRH
jgi:hypothetical protein